MTDLKKRLISYARRRKKYWLIDNIIFWGSLAAGAWGGRFLHSVLAGFIIALGTGFLIASFYNLVARSKGWPRVESKDVFLWFGW